MTSHAITLHLKPPKMLDRIWYRRTGESAPLAESDNGPRSRRLVRLLPYRWRRIHYAYATSHGFFWLPCPLCGCEFGGHEGGASIPDPAAGPWMGVQICSQCTRTRNERGEVPWPMT